jgi:lipoic acid synthetase
MLNGKSCTRNCSFCLVDTAKPEPFDGSEPARVADAVQEMGLEYVVLTAVARDDLADGGAETFAGTIRAIRAGRPGCQVEVLIPDFSGNEKAMDMVFAERPDVLNHNIETVLRLQRAVRSRASYQRSLGVLSKARSLGLVTKSGIMVGVGESDDEVLETLQDLHQVGVSIVTIGQYLRPSADHLAVKRWVEPATFERYRAFGESIGIAAVESGPYVRSSYHAAASKNRASGTSSA